MAPPPELVRLDRFDQRLRIDLRYAGAANFLGRVLYRASAAWLRTETAGKLSRAQDALERLGCGLLVLDAYRPPSAQAALWAALPDERFVAPPERGSRHTRGTAVDVALVDGAGSALEMPSAFDEFGPRAHRDWAGASEAARRHVDFLTGAMLGAGFSLIAAEWWHFDDADWRRHPLLTWELDGGGELAGGDGPGREGMSL